MAKRTPKRNFSSLTIADAFDLFQCDSFTVWNLDAPPLPPSDILIAIFKRLEGFDIEMSEAAKELLIDALFGEIIIRHEQMKIWKTAPAFYRYIERLRGLPPRAAPRLCSNAAALRCRSKEG